MELQYPFTISVTLLTVLIYHWMGYKTGPARVTFKSHDFVHCGRDPNLRQHHLDRLGSYLTACNIALIANELTAFNVT
jgi:hypothetical protein